MKLDLNKKVFSVYLVVLALGVAVSALVYYYGNDVLLSSRTLVAEDVPRLQRIASLKADLLAQESILYQYYATRDRRLFLRDYRSMDAQCAASLDTIARPFRDRDELQRVNDRYARIRALAVELDGVLAPASVDWEHARRVLSGISAAARDINGELDQLAELVTARVDASAARAVATVSDMRTSVILFSAAILGIALFVGYYVNAYISDYAERRRLAMFPERNPNPVMRLSLAGDVIYANPSAAALLNRVGADAPRALLPPDLGERLTALRQSADHYQLHQYAVGDRVLECGIHFLPDLDVYHAYVSDITERKLAEKRLVHQAYHDPLTGLSNRRMFEEQLLLTLHATDRGGMRAAVLLMGLDRFKVVTASLGHGVGDALLQAVAMRVQQVLDECRRDCHDAALYRFEGDLFSVLVPGFPTGDAPILLAEKILNSLHDPLYAHGREFFVTCSIGISIFPLDGQDVTTLLRNAETAMHRAKQQGGDAFQCYTLEMNARAAEWLALENHLRHALEHRELHLYYQPQIDIRSGRVTGTEALLRWQHPERGLLPPAIFVPLAEETGIITSLGDWILRTACAQNSAWHRRGLGGLTVAVNISARQFQQQDLPRLVASALDATGMDPRTLELEITETVAMRDVEHTTAALRELKHIGVKLSVDDFGTGFSSLSYLRRFPIDKLKIDQSFIRNLVTDRGDAAITRSVIALGHGLGLKVIAEGVETDGQLEQLRRDRCDAVQGLLFSGPVPSERLEALLLNDARLRVN